MNRKGITYDVGRVLGGNWRPNFDMKTVHRELEIIKNDLHCNAVRICGLDIARLMAAAEDALKQGLEVWLSPELWDKSQDETLAYLVKAATAAEKLHQQYPGKLVFLVGTELTIFMQGIVPGKNFMQRMGNPKFWESVKAGTHIPPLNSFLTRANTAVRAVFHGPVTYAGLLWEGVDWTLFDFVSVDHYRAAKNRDKYAESLKPLFAVGKPVVVTEFGSRTYQGADSSTEGMGGDLSDFKLTLPVILTFIFNQIRTSLFGVQLPPPRMRLKPGNYVRDERLQAREIEDMLCIFDQLGIDGGFIMTFATPTAPYNDNPQFDLDMNSYSLVKSYEDRRGTTYPEMMWEPKEAFRAVADYYGRP